MFAQIRGHFVYFIFRTLFYQIDLKIIFLLPCLIAETPLIIGWCLRFARIELFML